jgi:hypothetical protein
VCEVHQQIREAFLVTGDGRVDGALGGEGNERVAALVVPVARPRSPTTVVISDGSSMSDQSRSTA